MNRQNNQGLSRRDFLCNTGRTAAVTGGGLMLANTMASVAAAEQDGTNGFRVGWATVSITPDKPVQLAGQFHERVSTEGILYPCVATALAMEKTGPDDQHEQAILVACDLVNVGREYVSDIRQRVAELLPDFDSAKLSINTTHTHTGPTLNPGSYKAPDPGVMGPEAYAPFFCERAAEAAVQAWRARRTAAMNHAVGHAAVGFNRIAAYADGSSRMYGNSAQSDFVGLEGGHDHGLELVFLWRDAATLSGIIINIACPAQVVEGQRYLSADFWGPVRETIKKTYGENVSVYPMISAAGDQSPRDLVRRGRNEPDMRAESGMREMARRIVNGVRDAYDNTQSDRDTNPVFRHHSEEITLPTRQVTEKELAEAQQERERLLSENDIAPGSRNAAMLRRANGIIDRYERAETSFAMDLHVLRIGDVAVATNPFELYLDYGLRIKGRSPANQTLVVQLANDRGRYLPTPRAVEGGAYGARITENIVGPEGGDVLGEKTLDAINLLWEA